MSLTVCLPERCPGKNFSKGTNNDLDDISSKTGITLKSCRRQVQALQRTVPPSNLSLYPSRDYAAIVFFANSHFETGKRKLQYLSFQDFAFCADQLISYWTIVAVDSLMEDMDVD
ncbi:hypothetical protein J4Q44_G00122850 [Coregonus suidteri]|uniref:Uncharacterized protein n=1 Tax=Coregonus suidteri TaxID=861788 RepID=A0AAN8M1Y4_9TELE